MPRRYLERPGSIGGDELGENGGDRHMGVYTQFEGLSYFG